MIKDILEGHRRVVVIGLGKVTGKAVTEALLELGAEVRVFESTQNHDHRATAAGLREMGAEITFGEPDHSLLEWADLVIPCPGVLPSHPLLAEALRRRIPPVWSEIELGFRLAPGPVFAVTGTNGKTTVTTLLTAILNLAGRPAVAAGNIGLPLVEAARNSSPGTILVCEASSFQLFFTDSFRPSIAIALNVAEDHYDWHSHLGHYLYSKYKIARNQKTEDLVIVKFDDVNCLSIAFHVHSLVAAFGMSAPGTVEKTVHKDLRPGSDPRERDLWAVAGIDGSDISIAGPAVARGATAGGPLISLTDIRLPGAHNAENVMAASLAAIRAGVELKTIAETVKTFEGLPHRMTLVAERDGVRYVDDSKATNPHATLGALAGLRSVVLIAGGRAKGLDLSVLREGIEAIKAVVVMGEAADALEAIFNDLECRRAEAVEDAVRIAAELAQPGDTVLLSPACASWDQYTDYAERGNRFAKAVLAL